MNHHVINCVLYNQDNKPFIVSTEYQMYSITLITNSHTFTQSHFHYLSSPLPPLQPCAHVHMIILPTHFRSSHSHCNLSGSMALRAEKFANNPSYSQQMNKAASYHFNVQHVCYSSSFQHHQCFPCHHHSLLNRWLTIRLKWN